VAVGDDTVVERCRDGLDPDATDDQIDLCALKWLPNQVDTAIDDFTGRQTLVTITVGANDTGWTDPLGLISLMLATDDEFRSSIDAVGEQVGVALSAEIDRLLAEPNVTVIVTDVYNPFNAESVLFDFALMAQEAAWGTENVGQDPCTGIDREGVLHEMSCAERAEYGLQALRSAIEGAAGRDPRRVASVSLIEPFRGHESPQGVCGGAEPSSGVTWIRDTAGGGLVPFPDCFHPNTAGVEAIAALILDAWAALNAQ
jgi:lysophospholipase L1-like esterase